MRRGPLLLAVVAVVLLLPSAAAVSEPASLAGLPELTYVAHRGGASEGREGSLSAYEHVLAAGAAQVLDLDARLLADGTVVVMHDPTVDRTSTGAGPVAGLTADEWAALRLDGGSWLPFAPAPEPPPTLAEVLDRYGRLAVISVELKDPAALEPVARLITGRGLRDSVLVSSNDPAIARQVHDHGLLTQLWRSATQMRTDDPAAFASYVDVLEADIYATDADLARFANSGVLRAWVHTVTTRAQRDRAVALGLDGIITDDPEYLSGRVANYPVSPTLLSVLRMPVGAQVSDPASMSVNVSAESSTALPEAALSVTGGGVRATEVSTTSAGTTLLALDTGAMRRGPTSLTLSVPAGAGGERTWPAGSSAVDFRLRGEDLELTPAVSTSTGRARLSVALLDSAARGYRGPRREVGHRRTVAGIGRARLQVTVRRYGEVYLRRTVPGYDTGPRDDGIGSAALSWRASEPGVYDVRIRQVGRTYAPVHARLRFTMA